MSISTKGSRCGVDSWKSERITELEKDNDHLRYVLGGVLSAIKTGQNEPL